MDETYIKVHGQWVHLYRAVGKAGQTGDFFLSRLASRFDLASTWTIWMKQDHRRVKQRIRPMLGFKRFDNAAVTISGIELAEKIKKEQFRTSKLGGCDATMTELWNAALVA